MSLGTIIPSGGTATNGVSALINSIAQYMSSGGILLFPKQDYFLESSCLIPAGVSVVCEPGTRFIPTNTFSFTNGFAFLINTNDGVNWNTAYTNISGAEFTGANFYNSDNPSRVYKAICVGSAINVHDVSGNHIHQLIKSTNNYLDFFTISRAFVQEPQGSNYQIELVNLGDGLRINQVSAALSSGVGKFISLVACQGGVLESVIGGGDVAITQCRGLQILGLHSETGVYTFDESDVSIRDSYFWSGNSPRIVTGNGNRTLKLDNVLFVNNINTYPASYDSYDIQVSSTYNLELTNVYKASTVNGGVWVSQLGGVRLKNSSATPFTQFNKYSHQFSRSGRVIASNKINIDYSLDIGSGSFTAFDFPTNADTATTWKIASGTYKYQCALIYDSGRSCGVINTQAETSLVLTNGAGCARLNLTSAGLSQRNQFATLRIYRGTVSSQYNFYVDIPLINSALFYDDGNFINGYPWISRTASGVDPVFNITNIEMRGNKFIARGTAAPTVGTWSVGDRIEKSAPTASSNEGWVCVTAGTPGTWKTYGSTGA